MLAEVDSSSWSGEGDFTHKLIDWCTSQSTVSFIRVEDAPSSRSDVEYNFISNEIFLQFQTHDRVKKYWLWKFVSIGSTVAEKLMTLEQLESKLACEDDIGAPDYADKEMIQYLHTERIIPPYQTKGYKLIELVRIYEVGTPRRDS